MDQFRSLTVGQVSGILALGTSLVTYTIPLLVGVFLLRYHNREASAATWSVIARQLHTSAWPGLLRTDSATVRNVERRVTAVSFIAGFMGILTLVAGIVTPLGLYDEIASLDNRTVEFVYLQDATSFGMATQHRPELAVTRDCGSPYQLCPGTYLEGSNVAIEGTSKPLQAQISTAHVPENITSLFSSHSGHSTVAGILDLQYRFWKRQTTLNMDNNEPYVTGLYRQVNNLIPLGKGAMLVEGAIVDMDNGGLGYRNHSVPKVAASWSEDILWIAPEISCTGTNLSFEMVLEAQNSTTSGSMPFREIQLVDDGGFFDLRDSDPKRTWENIVSEPGSVQDRATQTARLHNLLLGMIFNVTNSTSFSDGTNALEGGRYPLSLDMMNSTIQKFLWPLKPMSTCLNTSWFGLPDVKKREDGVLESTDGIFTPAEAFPYQFASLLMKDLQQRCTQSSGEFTLQDDQPTIECSFFLSSPNRIDGGSVLEEEAGSRWKSQLSICAGAVKASVKTVSMSSNLTEGAALDSVTIASLEDRYYAGESSYPLWAVEDWRYPGNEGAKSAPLWGIVANSYANTPGHNFTRSPSIYLPPSDLARWQMTATGSGRADVNLKDNLAGTVAPRGVLAQVLRSAFATDQMWIPNYSGLHCLALRSKWQKLSGTPEGAANILRLVWTDIMASVTLGAKLHPSIAVKEVGPDALATGDGESDTLPVVTMRGRRIAYKMKYSAPGIILLVAWLLLALAAFPVAFIHRPFTTHLARLLNNTSLGRTAAVAREHEEVRGGYYARELAYSSTFEWVRTVGEMRMRVGPQVYGEPRLWLRAKEPRRRRRWERRKREIGDDGEGAEKGPEVRSGSVSAGETESEK